MKLFSKSKKTRNLDQFKNHSQRLNEQALLDSITGGNQVGCHKVGGGKALTNLDAYGSISTGAFNITAINTGALTAF